MNAAAWYAARYRRTPPFECSAPLAAGQISMHCAAVPVCKAQQAPMGTTIRGPHELSFLLYTSCRLGGVRPSTGASPRTPARTANEGRNGVDVARRVARLLLLVNDAARSSLRLARLVGLLELKVPRPCCENRFLARCSLGSYDLCPSPSYAFSFVISLSFLGLVCIFIGSVRTSVASDR